MIGSLRGMRLLVFALTLTCALLTYIPAPQDADGLAMLAVSNSMLQHGGAEMDARGAQDWLLLPYGRIGSLGIDNALYAKKGPTPSLLMLPLVAMAYAAPWLSVLATASLLNGLIHAVTAVILYDLIVRSSYRQRTAFVLSLIYAAGTMAIAYVKTLFGEPLAALLLLNVIWLLYPTAPLRLWRLAIVGALLAACMGINLIYAVFIPIIVLWLARRQLTGRAWIALATSLSLGVLLLLLYNWARFGHPFTSGYQFSEGEGFSYPVLLGLYGLYLSPYRGLLWYNPVLMVAPLGWYALRKLTPRLFWLIPALILAQTFAFATWWSWHGGIVWGPRFLLPVLPLMVFCLAPLVEMTWERRGLFITFGTLAGLSVAVQLLGVLLAYLPYGGYLGMLYYNPYPWHMISDLWLSPLLAHMALLRAGFPLEPAWLANADAVHVVIALGLAGLAWWLVRLRWSARVRWGVWGTAALLGLNMIVARQQSLPAVQRVQQLDQALNVAGVMAVASDQFGDNLLDLERQRYVISLVAPTRPDDERAQRVWTHALNTTAWQHLPLWFVTWFGPATTENWQEQQLWQTWWFRAEVNIANHRALLFQPDVLAFTLLPTASATRFGDALMLESYTLHRNQQGVYVLLNWRATAIPHKNYSWFIHVLDGTGTIIAQQDRWPQGGYVPTTGWAVGQVVADRLYFPMPATASDLHIRLGWVDPDTGERLPIQSADGMVNTDGYILLKVPPAKE